MKNKQVLNINQMRHLQELGLDTSNASMLYCDLYDEEYILVESKHRFDKEENAILLEGVRNSVIYCKKVTPAYTLQDVLDALPIQIEIPLHPEWGKFELRIKRMVFNTGKVMHVVVYEESDYINWFVLQSHEELIDAAYEMLCWVIEQGYVETNKNE